MLRTGPFRRLWYATALASFGDWLGLLATTALATQLAGTYRTASFALGGVLLVRLLPAILLGPLAGAFADRFDRRWTMVITDIVRFALFITIPVAVATLEPRQALTWLYVSTFLIECISMFWLPAKDASVPNLVRNDQVEAANQLGLITTYGITPVLAAALFSTLSVITDFLADHLPFFETNATNLALYFKALTSLVGAVVVLFITEISGHRQNRPAKGEGPGLFGLLHEGAQFVRSSKLIGGLIVGLTGAFIGAGAVIGAGKLYVDSLGAGDAAYGVLFGAVFVGLGLGMAFGPRIARELSRRRLFGLTIIGGGLCLVGTAVAPYIWVAMLLVLGIGFCAGVAYLCGVTLMGTEVDDQMRGRVFALLQSLIRVILMLGLASVPFVVGWVGRRTFSVGELSVTVDGTRFVLVAGGVLATLAGVLAYRKLDDRQTIPVWVDFISSLRGDNVARRRLRGGGVLIAFEGGEGSGKSTQIDLLAQALREAGEPVVVTHEPGATPAGQRIRHIVLHHESPLSPRAEALLFAADRAHHVDTVIKPALEAGEVVLTDRFVDSSLAYQGAGRELTLDQVRKLSKWATEGLQPDLTVLLDVPADVGLARAKNRSGADKLEAESIAFHERVREAFVALAESDPRRYVVIDGTKPAEEQAAQVRAVADRVLALRRSVPVRTPREILEHRRRVREDGNSDADEVTVR